MIMRYRGCLSEIYKNYRTKYFVLKIFAIYGTCSTFHCAQSLQPAIWIFITLINPHGRMLTTKFHSPPLWCQAEHCVLAYA